MNTLLILWVVAGDASQEDDDEVATVAAGDDEARESAAAAFAMKTPEQNKKAQPRKSLSSQPKLDRAAQSKQVLAETKERGNEQLKRKAALAIEDAPTSVKQPKATAVKAKAKPVSMAIPAKTEDQPSPDVKPESTVANQLPTAVDSCLVRATTTELNNGNTTEMSKGRKDTSQPKKPKVVEQDPPEPSDPGSSDSEDEETVKKIKKAKEAHARYMRFSRSLKSTLDLLDMYFPPIFVFLLSSITLMDRLG